MGASDWSYFVPYQPNINRALQDLRAKVFADGDYYLSEWTVEECEEALSELEADYGQGQIPADYYEENKRDLENILKRTQRGAPPASIEELYEWTGESGTHSILDIDKASNKPKNFLSMKEMSEQARYKYQVTGNKDDLILVHSQEELDFVTQSFQTIYPLSDQDLLELFETVRPTRPMTLDNQDKISALLSNYDRYTGFYFVVYKDDSPDEIFIHGFSGD